MCFLNSGMLLRHCFQVFRIAWRASASQSNLSSHNCWSSTFGLIIAGEHHSKTLNSLATSVLSASFIRFWYWVPFNSENLCKRIESRSIPRMKQSEVVGHLPCFLLFVKLTSMKKFEHFCAWQKYFSTNKQQNYGRSQSLLRDNPQSKFMELTCVLILIASCTLLLQEDCYTATTLASSQLIWWSLAAVLIFLFTC